MEELAQLGLRLRAARSARGWTLDRLARSAGISPSTLSRLESGKRQASLELLLPLTRSLGITVDELLVSASPDPRVQRDAWEHNGMLVQPLSPESSPVHTYKVSYVPRPAITELGSHDGYEWLYVLSGRLRLQLGEEEIHLGADEAAEFDTLTPHGLSALGPENAVVICILNEAAVHRHTEEHGTGHTGRAAAELS
ncbi:helix-turn-helix domain-containing protein [Nesterenkonia lutea]|uniref:Transcriptional regulator with XRE-family HTH domain n=1 Tax=Nesterenkonia lutea TaxID=272919 RepID=A0ABR9JCI4_9MICC|nr:XRE family transcriptional regulator [Nesterenkonia lutea]MBE1523656.1 transcriptional regulator with XRE-family HTH domain [Nesterenkonia lutea]